MSTPVFDYAGGYPTWDEYKKAATVAAHEGRARNVNPAMLAQAAVSANQLTGSEPWDRYLSYLQQRLEELEPQQRDFADKVADIFSADVEQMMYYKLRLAEVKGAVQALQYAMTLPSEIMKAQEHVTA